LANAINSLANACAHAGETCDINLQILARNLIDKVVSSVCFYYITDPATNQNISLNCCMEVQTKVYTNKINYNCVTGKQVWFNQGNALMALNSNPNFIYLFSSGMSILPDGFNNGSSLKIGECYRRAN
jgi:hypothetical protein